MNAPLVAVTLGDPAGIGPEVVAKAALDPALRTAVRFVAVGPAHALEVAASGSPLRVRRVSPDSIAGSEDEIPVIDVPADLEQVSTGRVTAEAGRVALSALELSVRLALSGEVDAIATGPWNKEAIDLAAGQPSGHTERLAMLTSRDPGRVSMLLVHDQLRVFHVTTHVPLRSVFDHITTERVAHVVRLAHFVTQQFGIAHPRIGVAGLNPHAGEHGLFGAEDQREIEPAVAQAREDQIDAVGPVPADTLFVRAQRGEFDGVVAMYHDQGHVPVKLAGMGHAVNVTVGLPVIRTSVDHGTAFDIAGQGVAEPTSMVDAILLAGDLARRRVRFELPAQTAQEARRIDRPWIRNAGRDGSGEE